MKKLILAMMLACQSAWAEPLVVETVDKSDWLMKHKGYSAYMQQCEKLARQTGHESDLKKVSIYSIKTSNPKINEFFDKIFTEELVAENATLYDNIDIKNMKEWYHEDCAGELNYKIQYKGNFNGIEQFAILVGYQADGESYVATFYNFDKNGRLLKLKDIIGEHNYDNFIKKIMAYNEKVLANGTDDVCPILSENKNDYVSLKNEVLNKTNFIFEDSSNNDVYRDYYIVVNQIGGFALNILVDNGDNFFVHCRESPTATPISYDEIKNWLKFPE